MKGGKCLQPCEDPALFPLRCKHRYDSSVFGLAHVEPVFFATIAAIAALSSSDTSVADIGSNSIQMGMQRWMLPSIAAGSRSKAIELWDAFHQWSRTYRRPGIINEEFASHFESPEGW
jgi:hypothetical protein